MIKTKPVEQEINLFDIDCVIFTSKNGDKYFFKNKQIIDSKLDDKFFICIGKKTAQKLKGLGFEAGYVCKKNYSNLVYKV